jgi:hypothetical protein
MRETRVYRLFIAYPEGSLEPGWIPEHWEETLAGIADRKRRRAIRQRGFRWPRERMFLSSSSAYDRAGLLRWFGAEVEVMASEPVTWWELDADAFGCYPDLSAEPEPGTGAVAGELPGFEDTTVITAEDIDAVLAEYESTR